jgi:hypothetical protein
VATEKASSHILDNEIPSNIIASTILGALHKNEKDFMVDIDQYKVRLRCIVENKTIRIICLLRLKNEVSRFIINNQLFKIIGTHHSVDMAKERGIDEYNIAGRLLTLGESLLEYNNSGKHLLIRYGEKNCSCVFTIEDYTIVLITVIDKGNAVVSPFQKETVIVG